MFSFCRLFLGIPNWAGVILVLRRSRSGLTFTFSGLWSFTLLSEPVSQAGDTFKPAALLKLLVGGRPTFTSGHLLSRAPKLAGPREPGTGSSGAWRAALAPTAWERNTPLAGVPYSYYLPDTLRAGDAVIEWGGIRVVTKKIAHTTREEGDLAIYCVITGTDSLNWPWLPVLPTEPKLLYCLFAPTTGPHHCWHGGRGTVHQASGHPKKSKTIS